MSGTTLGATSWAFASRYVKLPRENVDTDQIIPARFLTTTTREGLGPHAFHDWRYLPDGTPDPDFPLNSPSAHGASILVAGHNFGCGSSREHAVWALLGAGFRAVVSSTFADIFRANALGNGLLPIETSAATLAQLLSKHDPGRQLAVDLRSCTLTLPDAETVNFPVPAFARHCLLHGVDEMQVLLDAQPELEEYERRHPASIDTAAGAPV